MSENKIRSKQSYLDAFNARGLTYRSRQKRHKLKHVPAIIELARKNRRRRNLDRAGKRVPTSYHDALQTWKADEAERKSEPEAKRARKDPVFRKVMLRRLRDRKRNILKSPARTCQALTELFKRRAQDNGELWDIAAKQSIILGRTIKPATMPHYVHYGAKLGAADRYDLGELADQAGVKVVRRGENWKVEATILPSSYIHEDGKSRYRHGGWLRLGRAVNTTKLRLFCMIRSPRVLECAYHDQERLLELPEGFAWAIDGSDIRVFRLSSPRDDYHLTAQDMAIGTVRYLLERLEVNCQRRRAIAAQEAAYLADKEGVWVCLADSIRAGNCLVGSTSFAARHNINPARHYPATELLSMANGDAGRVRLAITAASIRHRKELARGYSDLEEHQCLT